MFTLNFPIVLPDQHFFFDNGQYAVPPLPGGLCVGCIHSEGAPVVLQISGFKSAQDAVDFCSPLRAALRLAALDSEHSISPSRAQPVMSQGKPFDGNVPTVAPTSENLRPYHASISQQNGLHISVLAKRLGSALSQAATGGSKITPNLSLGLELYSDCEFAGERNAQFIVLMTALEVLVAKGNANGKRGAVTGLVKQAVLKAGRSDWGAVRKSLAELYAARNALVHDAQSVTNDQLVSLKIIVKDTLKALAN
jgi:hypothetical protein